MENNRMKAADFLAIQQESDDVLPHEKTASKAHMSNLFSDDMALPSPLHVRSRYFMIIRKNLDTWSKATFSRMLERCKDARLKPR